jgi:hypothetical protein
MKEVGQKTADKHHVTCHPAAAVSVLQKILDITNIYYKYTCTAAASPHTIVTVTNVQKVIVYYFEIWNNDAANVADVCLYIGGVAYPLYTGIIPSRCGVIANLVRPIQGTLDSDVILSVATSTDVDVTVHAELV